MGKGVGRARGRVPGKVEDSSMGHSAAAGRWPIVSWNRTRFKIFHVLLFYFFFLLFFCQTQACAARSASRAKSATVPAGWTRSAGAAVESSPYSAPAWWWAASGPRSGTSTTSKAQPCPTAAALAAAPPASAVRSPTRSRAGTRSWPRGAAWEFRPPPPARSR